MKFDKLKQDWNQLGEENAYWAILTNDEYKDKLSDDSAFFETGRKSIRVTFRILKNHNISFEKGCALDFGCGIGRLTQALAESFKEVHGVDIAQSMIKLANEKNRFPDSCNYHLNEHPDLKIFKDNYFDFVLTLIVLQHMLPKYAKSYIREFVRVTRPGGLIIFQLPSKPDEATKRKKSLISQIRRRLGSLFIKPSTQPEIDMNWIEESEIKQLLHSLNCTIELAKKDNHTGDKWESITYFVRVN